MVVGISPYTNLFLCIWNINKPEFIQTLITKFAVETFDECIVGRFPRPYMLNNDMSFFCPVMKDCTGEFRDGIEASAMIPGETLLKSSTMVNILSRLPREQASNMKSINQTSLGFDACGIWTRTGRIRLFLIRRRKWYGYRRSVRLWLITRPSRFNTAWIRGDPYRL